MGSVGLQPARVRPCSISHVKRPHSNTGSAETMPTCCTSFGNADGSRQFGKWIFEPLGSVQGLADDEAKAKGPGFLLDDLREGIKQCTVAFSFNPVHPAASARTILAAGSGRSALLLPAARLHRRAAGPPDRTVEGGENGGSLAGRHESRFRGSVSGSAASCRGNGACRV